MREVCDAGEVDHQRQPQHICHVDRDIQRVIVAAALRALHPVDDAFSFARGRAAATHRYSRIIGKLLQLSWNIVVPICHRASVSPCDRPLSLGHKSGLLPMNRDAR